MTFTRPIKRDDFTIVFLGECNSRATLMAEALVRAHGMPGVRAFSAGITPADGSDRLAIAALAQLGVEYDGLWPKHWLGLTTDRAVSVHKWVAIGTIRLPSSLFRQTQPDRLHRWRDPFMNGRPKDFDAYVDCGHRLNTHIVQLLEDVPLRWPCKSGAVRMTA